MDLYDASGNIIGSNGVHITPGMNITARVRVTNASQVSGSYVAVSLTMHLICNYGNTSPYNQNSLTIADQTVTVPANTYLDVNWTLNFPTSSAGMIVKLTAQAIVPGTGTVVAASPVFTSSVETTSYSVTPSPLIYDSVAGAYVNAGSAIVATNAYIPQLQVMNASKDIGSGAYRALTLYFDLYARFYDSAGNLLQTLHVISMYQQQVGQNTTGLVQGSTFSAPYNAAGGSLKLDGAVYLATTGVGPLAEAIPVWPVAGINYSISIAW